MDTVEQRLERIEASLRTVEQRERRWRLTAIGLLSAIVVGIGGALTSASTSMTPLSQDVVRTKRLEIAGDDGKVVLLASVVDGSGQLDLWNRSGANTARLSSPDTGGDMVLWNEKGQMVVGAYAGIEGGRFEAFRADGTPGFRAAAATVGSAISITSATGKEVLYAGSDERGAGLLRIADPNGQTVAAMLSSTAGGLFESKTASGSPAAVIGAGAGGASGIVQVSGSGSKPAVEIDVRSDGAGRLAMGGAEGATNLLLESGAQDGGLLSFFLGGSRMVALGCGTAGGQLNLAGLDGRNAVVLGAAADGHGGAVSVRGADGQQVVRCSVDPLGDGEVAVYSAGGQKKKVITPE